MVAPHRNQPMSIDLNHSLSAARDAGKHPRVTAYHRLDGPGSSFDLREFQSAFWQVPAGHAPADADAFGLWSKALPRTVAITISTGSTIEAHPHKIGRLGLVAHDLGVEYDVPAGKVPYDKETWLVKLMDVFGISGVRFDLSNLIAGTKSSGLGGSATIATGVALLANALAGAPFTHEQIVPLAALMEQDLGISITGSQEQSNVVYGGVTDYVWFPWGVPGTVSGFGTSLRRTLLSQADYPELRSHLSLFHTGTERLSTNVNAVWRERLRDAEGFDRHRAALALAYDFREGLRAKDWARVSQPVGGYRKIRTELCSGYMTRECHDIQLKCAQWGAGSFPLGAGGGGAVMVFSPS
ncbi:MAG: GHMP kinase [Betaproteobacteria bacterium]|nr:GHMP kinase [Betaproteobacteria bacterium]